MRDQPDGAPDQTMFAEIEQFGHEIVRMLGQAVDQQLTSLHVKQFQRLLSKEEPREQAWLLGGKGLSPNRVAEKKVV